MPERGTWCLGWIDPGLGPVSSGLASMMTICVPPPEIRRRIASILSACDDLIENDLRHIRILEEMARSLCKEWFIDFRFPGREHTPQTVKYVSREGIIGSEIGIY